ncbi:MAG: GxxExxY protein [Lentimonas sp.]
MSAQIAYKDESYDIIGACFEVYKEMGTGFLEAVYQESLAKEFSLRGIPYKEQQPLELRYKGALLQQTYKPDFLCYGEIILEIKALKNLTDIHRSQTIHYLHATNLQLGLLVNFGHSPDVEHERFVNQS